MYRHAVVVEPGSWYRVDTASGSSTPTSVLQPDGVTTVPNAYGLTGSTVRNGSPQGEAVFLSTVQTLYLKRLTYQGALSGDTPITSTGRDLTPTPDPLPGGSQGGAWQRITEVDVRDFMGSTAWNSTTDKTAGLVAALAASTLSVPLRIKIPPIPGGTKVKIAGTALTVPLAPGTEIVGSGSARTVLEQQDSALPVIQFTAADTFGCRLADLGIAYATPQTDPASVAVYYRVPGGTVSGFYTHVYERLTVTNAYRGFSLADTDGQQTIWGTSWRNIRFTGIKDRLISLAPASAIGIPAVSISGISALNTGGSALTTTGPAFKFTACEVAMFDLDIEGWYNEVIWASGGGFCTVNGLHVEHHVLSAANARVFYAANGPMSVDGFNITGVTTAGCTGAAQVVKTEFGGRAQFRNGNHAIDAALGGAPIKQFFTTDYTSRNSVSLRNVTDAGSSISQPSTDFDVRPARVAAVDPVALRNFSYALGNRDTAPCDLLHIGDSITAGYKVGALSKRWTNILRDLMRTRFPQTAAGGAGFISSFANPGSVTSFSDTPTAASGGSDVDQNFGLDARGHTMTAAGHTVTVTFTGTGLDFTYAQYGGGGTFSWEVDGGAATNISSNGATNFAQRNTTAIRGLSVGAHTVVFRYVSGGTVYFTGAAAYNGDETKGIRSWTMGQPGWSSSTWWDTSKNYWWDHIPWVNPDLVTIEMGPNDYGGGTPVSVATFTSNVQSIVSTIKAKVTGGYVPSFVLMPVWAITPTGSTLSPWASYVDAMYSIAAADADSSVCVLDLQQRVNPGPPGTAGGYLPDGTHPEDAGNKALAETIAGFIAPK